jgi:hypothetical protein
VEQLTHLGRFLLILSELTSIYDEDTMIEMLHNKYCYDQIKDSIQEHNFGHSKYEKKFHLPSLVKEATDE